MESLKHIDKLKDYIKKDVEKLFNLLLVNDSYQVLYNGKYLDKKLLYSKLISDLSNFNTCNYVSSKGKMCSSKKYSNYKYCKKHIGESNVGVSGRVLGDSRVSTMDTVSTKTNLSSKPPELLIVKKESVKVDTNNFKKQFINDTLYHIDSKYIYNPQTSEKVGYIKKKKNGNFKYILTSDPFILEFI